MKIAVIRVGMIPGKSNDAMKPLLFPIIESLTPLEHSLEFWDDRAENLPAVLDADVVALSVETFAARRAYALARQYKTHGNLVVMGGFHPSMEPQECAQHCDVVVVGDSEDTWPRLLEDAKAGRAQPLYVSENAAPLAGTLPQSRAFVGKRYLPLAMVQFSRGCKYHCDFCSVKAMYPGEVRQRPVAELAAEIGQIKERYMFFIDDNLFLDEESALALFAAIKPYCKRWACQVSLDVAMNPRLLEAMASSGCFLVLMGFESLSQVSLVAMGKVANLRVGDYKKALENLRRFRLLVYGTFVLGYDGDTLATIQETVAFAKRHRMALANFNPLIPMPGTNLHRRLQAEKRLLHEKWWLEPGYRYGDTTFLPVGMTPEELEKGCWEARSAFYSWKSIWNRLWANRRHLGLVFVANWASRREIGRKQGRRLGE